MGAAGLEPARTSERPTSFQSWPVYQFRHAPISVSGLCLPIGRRFQLLPIGPALRQPVMQAGRSRHDGRAYLGGGMAPVLDWVDLRRGRVIIVVSALFAFPRSSLAAEACCRRKLVDAVFKGEVTFARGYAHGAHE